MDIINYITQAFTDEHVSFIHWMIVCGIGVGTILGSVDLILGIIKGKHKLGVIGFFSVIAANSLVGFILGAPTMAVFIWLILKPKKDKLLDAEEEEEDDDLKDVELDEEDLKDEEEDK